MIAVKLSPQEIMLAVTHAGHRAVDAHRRGAKDRSYIVTPDRFWAVAVYGVMAEMAVSKFTKSYWTGAERIGASDAGRYQVRSTTLSNGHLPLRPDDSDRDIYILVITQCFSLSLAGWILGADGKQDKYWGSKGKSSMAFWIPQSDLHDIHTLPGGGA